jgi:hypothetical protein
MLTNHLTMHHSCNIVMKLIDMCDSSDVLLQSHFNIEILLSIALLLEINATIFNYLRIKQNLPTSTKHDSCLVRQPSRDT